MKTIGFIGTGNMGGAIIRRVAPLGKWRILIHDVRVETAKLLAQETGCTYAPLEELASQSDIIVLAVKPQVLPGLYATLQTYAGKGWISMAAGVSLETLAKGLKTTEVVRIMPNIAAAVGKAVTALAAHPKAGKLLVDESMKFIGSFGSAHQLEETHFGAFIGISGSAIATVFAFLHGMAMGGVHEGLPYAKALELIGDTTESAIALVRSSGRHPAELLTQVCSPSGTTIESVQVLEGSGFSGILMDSVEAASERAKALEASAKTGD